MRIHQLLHVPKPQQRRLRRYVHFTSSLLCSWWFSLAIKSWLFAASWTLSPKFRELFLECEFLRYGWISLFFKFFYSEIKSVSTQSVHWKGRRDRIHFKILKVTLKNTILFKFWSKARVKILTDIDDEYFGMVEFGYLNGHLLSKSHASSSYHNLTFFR